MTVLLKEGLAPPEQYQTHRTHGPWEDVYALCASMYYSLTGTIPPMSLERLSFDSLPTLSAMKVDIPQWFESIILKGMEPKVENRYQSMNELYEDIQRHLNNKEEAPQPNQKLSAEPSEINPESNDELKPEKLFLIGIAVVLVIIVLLLIVALCS